MSKKSKNAQALVRKKEKRAKKDRQQATYEGYKVAGTNTKSKRTKLANKRSTKVGTKSHPDGACFNHGCYKCNQFLNDPANASPNSCIYGKNWSSPKHR